jgi:hypothetical protein
VSIFTRIVCDNPGCQAQAEQDAGDYYSHYMGREKTPPNWYGAQRYSEQAGVMPEYVHFCSLECMRSYRGSPKKPETRSKSEE